MVEAEVIERLSSVVKDILDLESLSLTKEMTAMDIEGWDSLSHINIIVAVEEEFNCSLSLSEMKKLKSIGDFIDL